VGSNSGIIENCYVSGNVIIMGTDLVGGLIGISVEGGRIENCYASGSIGGNNQIGGFLHEHDLKLNPAL
jgi:methylglyoxal synthase